MSLRPIKIQITTSGDPFEHCKLDRRKYAEILTKIIETYSDGFVLAINNKWGEGKTTFIEMWKVFLGNSGYKTLYFNAWEHDLNHDPLSAILSELKSLDIYEKQEFAPLLKKGAKLTRSLIPIFLGAVAEKYIDTKILKEAFQKLTEEAATIFEEEVNEYANKKKGLEDFKKELEAYISKLEQKPLVFFIDELDRCNPKYAVEFLEVVKHFFSVPGIVFVLSIDKEQLGNSIRGYFGSEHINTDEYLRRFIDLEYSLPSPKVGEFIRYLFEKSGINVFIKNPKRQNTYFDRNESDQFFSMANTFFMHNNSDLRSIEKILFHLSIVLKSFSPASRTLPEVLFILLYMKFKNQNMYGKIKNRNLKPEELLQVFYDFIPTELKVNSNIKLYGLEAMLLFLYSKSPNYGGDYNLWKGKGANEVVLYKSKFDSQNNQNFTELLSTYRREGIEGIENLNFLINKIELTERFVE